MPNAYAHNVHALAIETIDHKACGRMFICVRKKFIKQLRRKFRRRRKFAYQISYEQELFTIKAMARAERTNRQGVGDDVI
jgi:predicted ferric reductase